jgi:hypothetical protein
MTETDEQMVPLSEVNAAIDRVSEQVQSECMLGATREQVAEGTAARIKAEVNACE